MCTTVLQAAQENVEAYFAVPVHQNTAKAKI